jgi:Tfp pilus assembly protein PilX
MSTTQIIALIVVLAIIVAVVLAAVMVMRRRALRQRFGPEYDRAVESADSRSAAEAELRERERRHAELQLTTLTPQQRAAYAQEWEQVQARFVEQPAATVGEADRLVTRLVHDRGYPTDDYDEALAHLSVEHGHTLSHYRDAHEISLATERGEATTEQLRQALMHYRTIFADILGEQPVPDADAAPAQEPTTDSPAATPTQRG